MASYNKVILMGGLTRDPELKDANGTAVCDISLAVSEKYKDKEYTTYVDIVAWGKTAELCAQYLAKGRQILVDGRLQLDQWENQQGEKRSKLRVRADRVQFLSDGKGKSAEGGQAAQSADSGVTSEDVAGLGDDTPEKDLPF
jgi:single-strand DNA-binding protein